MKNSILIITLLLICSYSQAQSFIKNTVGTNLPGASDVITIDLDGDTDIDIIGLGGDLAWYENDGSQNFTKYSIDNVASGTQSKVFAADMDNDNDIDLVSSSYSQNDLIWYENDGSQNFTKHFIETSFSNISGLFLEDIDNDGDIDITATTATSNPANDEIAWWKNNGNGIFIKLIIDTSPGESYAISAKDIDSDGDIDIVANNIQRDVFWYKNNGNENFTKLSVNGTLLGTYTKISIEDIDNDGDEDIVSTNYPPTGEIIWYENDGNENFSLNIIHGNNGLDDHYVVDIDGDSDMDIIGVIYTTDEVLFYENDGSENFTEHVINNSFDGALGINYGDIDGDSNLDIIGAAYLDSEISWWKNNLNLPVELTYFKAKKLNQTVLLKWQTETEENNKGFYIQKSRDGKTWEDLDFINGNGTTLEQKHYQYSDINPFENISYYRLKQVDFDGKSELSDVQSVNFKSVEKEVLIYPNPFIDNITIFNIHGKISIYNSFGQLIKEIEANVDEYTLDLSDYPKGIYHLMICQEDGSKIQQQIIKSK